MEPPSRERRSNTRFPLVMNVCYRTVSGTPNLSGAGRTVNMSSRGLLIASPPGAIHAGLQLRIALEWPVLLQGTASLQLLASARVVRCQGGCFAVQFVRYQFHTRKRQRLEIPTVLAAGA